MIIDWKNIDEVRPGIPSNLGTEEEAGLSNQPGTLLNPPKEKQMRHCVCCGHATEQERKLWNPDEPQLGECWWCTQCHEVIEAISETQNSLRPAFEHLLTPGTL
jgi:hypothetical protein